MKLKDIFYEDDKKIKIFEVNSPKEVLKIVKKYKKYEFLISMIGKDMVVVLYEGVDNKK